MIRRVGDRVHVNIHSIFGLQCAKYATPASKDFTGEALCNWWFGFPHEPKLRLSQTAGQLPMIEKLWRAMVK
jgi:hypothetical protein